MDSKTSSPFKLFNGAGQYLVHERKQRFVLSSKKLPEAHRCSYILGRKKSDQLIPMLRTEPPAMDSPVDCFLGRTFELAV